MAIREKVLGEEHPDTTGTYRNIASVYGRQGDYDKVLEWYQKALAVFEKVLGCVDNSFAPTNKTGNLYSGKI